jgi:hypothetical protein
MTKKLFCQLKYSFSCFKLAKLLGKKYTVDDADYFWSSKKITEFKKKILKLSHLFFSRYTCFLLLGMFQFEQKILYVVNA